MRSTLPVENRIESPPKRERRRPSLRRGLGAALALLVCGSFPGAAQDYPAAPPSPYKVDARLAWDRRALLIRVTFNLAAAGLRLPEGRLEAERQIERDLPGLAKDAVFSLQVDSYRTVSDTVMDGSLDPEELIALAKEARQIGSSFSRDMKELVASFEFPLDAIGALYVRHNQASPAPAALEWTPSRPHTGIVIVAQGVFPVHGEGVSDHLQPCLFPRVFDSGMRLLLDREAVDPDVLRARGEVGYASTVAYDERVGDDPLLVMASQIFGTDRTDLVIPREDALAILDLPANRELLREGRVTIVIDPGSLAGLPASGVQRAAPTQAQSP